MWIPSHAKVAQITNRLLGPKYRNGSVAYQPAQNLGDFKIHEVRSMQ